MSLYVIGFTVKKEVLQKFAELSIQDRNEVVEKQALKAVAGKVNEPSHEKTNNLGFRQGLTQTGLYSHRSRVEA